MVTLVCWRSPIDVCDWSTQARLQRIRDLVLFFSYVVKYSYCFDCNTVELSKFCAAFSANKTTEMYPAFDRRQSQFCCRHFGDDDREWDELNRAIWVGATRRPTPWLN